MDGEGGMVNEVLLVVGSTEPRSEVTAERRLRCIKRHGEDDSCHHSSHPEVPCLIDCDMENAVVGEFDRAGSLCKALHPLTTG